MIICTAAFFASAKEKKSIILDGYRKNGIIFGQLFNVVAVKALWFDLKNYSFRNRFLEVFLTFKLLFSTHAKYCCSLCRLRELVSCSLNFSSSFSLALKNPTKIPGFFSYFPCHENR